MPPRSGMVPHNRWDISN